MFAGNSITSYVSGGSTSATATLVGGGTGKIQRIGAIFIWTVGTVTAFNINVYRNDGTTSTAAIGGQVGGAATGPLGPYVWAFPVPINCYPGENAKVKVTATGASSTELTVNYTLATA